MGLFKKKSDPISERAKTLNQQIAALQAQIQRRSDVEPEPETPPTPPQEKPVPVPAPPVRPPAPPSSPQPRLRSTAFPQKHQPAHPTQGAGANPFSEPVFEEVGQN